jgi:hypothetical protein
MFEMHSRTRVEQKMIRHLESQTGKKLTSSVVVLQNGERLLKWVWEMSN